jgi:regulator of nucleoside diphosphate kinase
MVNQPNIMITELDLERLEKLIESLPKDSFPGKVALESELSRADVVGSHDIPDTVVTMNSTVRFKVNESKEEFSLTLVYPKDANSSERTLSILAPVGSALLGLNQGDEIQWPKPDGSMMTVRIEEVMYQPERAGEYHR